MEFFNLRLQAKFADFRQKEGWRKLSPEHGRQGHHDESGYDSSSAGGGDGAGGGRGSTTGPAVKVDGQMVSCGIVSDTVLILTFCRPCGR